MFQGTMIDELIEVVKRAQEHARRAPVPEARTLQPYEGFAYELPQSAAVMIGVA